MDGYLSPRAKKLVLQVKRGYLIKMQGVGLGANAVHLVKIAMNDLLR
jgi:hypothetical protein